MPPSLSRAKRYKALRNTMIAGQSNRAVLKNMGLNLPTWLTVLMPSSPMCRGLRGWNSPMAVLCVSPMRPKPAILLQESDVFWWRKARFLQMKSPCKRSANGWESTRIGPTISSGRTAPIFSSAKHLLMIWMWGKSLRPKSRWPLDVQLRSIDFCTRSGRPFMSMHQALQRSIMPHSRASWLRRIPARRLSVRRVVISLRDRGMPQARSPVASRTRPIFMRLFRAPVHRP